MKILLFVTAASLLAATAARAEVRGEEVEYADGAAPLRGYVAWDDGTAGKRPGVLIVHAWRGHGDFVREKARALAEMGYVAFALDMYGKGVYAKDNQEASQLAGRFYQDRDLMRRRARLGLEQLAKDERVDATRLGAIGFCFGGTVVLDLARHGEDLAAVVSFHGGLDFPDAPAEGAVKARVVVCHGADDPHVPAEKVLRFWQDMQAAKATYELLVISGAVHSFTEEAAGNDPSTGAAYDERAANIAWHAMHGTFREAFAR